MHAIMGAEFTATSMIGWIALAGIIVRNSILLVDFSVHEVQKGVPVTEAVLRACKTRTRPIVITALALVGGASVIFTDPIFQGMAISLASGVVVSTILTLIVIPLGCIKASRSLCEVAAVGCAPDAITMPEASASPAQPKPAGKTPLLLTLWGKLVGALLMVFYMIRGIFLLIAQLFKRKQPPPPAAPPAGGTPPAPRSPPPAPAAPSGGTGGTRAGSQDAPVSAAASASTEAAIEPATASVVEERQVVATAEPEVQIKPESVAAAPAAKPMETNQPRTEGAATGNKPVARKAPARKTIAKKVSVKKAAAKKAAVRKSAPRPAVRNKATRPTAPPVAKAAEVQKAPEARKRAETKAPRKGGRRGIRLKTRDTEGGIE